MWHRMESTGVVSLPVPNTHSHLDLQGMQILGTQCFIPACSVMQKAKHNVIQYYQLQSGSMATTMKRDKSYSAVISHIAVDICNAMFWNKIEKKY